jgi:iron complex transport system ATP-binding protein
LGVIMTTHAPDHAFAIADQTLVMGRGMAAAVGPTRVVLTAARLSQT